MLKLLRDRLTDREIADSLSIGVRTAESHVAGVRAKLGIASRRDAAAVAGRIELAKALPLPWQLITKAVDSYRESKSASINSVLCTDAFRIRWAHAVGTMDTALP